VGFTPDELTQNRFLDGKLNIWQPRVGYRAGADPVFLAASVAARSGQDVLELGCGAGVASLCLGWRVSGLKLLGVEVQADYAELARVNAAENGIEMDVITADLRDLPDVVRARSFDHVFANPPYFLRADGPGAGDMGRETALGGDTPLANWLDTAFRRLKPGGRLTLVQKPGRLPDILAALDHRFGNIVVKPLIPRPGRDAELIILQAQKGGRAPFRLLSPFILHQGAAHDHDGDSYTPAARAILRDGQALEIN